MTKKNQYTCEECTYISLKWLGKCPKCQSWNSFIEESKQKKTSSGTSVQKKAFRISEIKSNSINRWITQIDEFDRVMGGGIIDGSLNLIGGEPGIGKSTLLLLICSQLLKIYNEKILYISGEENENQIASRFKRMGLKNDELLILHETYWNLMKQVIEDEKPKFIILDSIQTSRIEGVNSAPGSISQVREVIYELMNLAKNENITCFVIGHITKDGNIAGPKVLEHMVDCVLSFEGDSLFNYRILRSQKNRFGNAKEVGVFEMVSNGLKEIKDPSLCFIDNNSDNNYGRSIACIEEGSRIIFMEIEALVVENKFGNGKRVSKGVDLNRLNLLLAVIEKYLDIPLLMNDIYLNIAGGLKLKDRNADLAIVAAILSSHFSKKIDTGSIYLGEVALTGQIKRDRYIDNKTREINRMGFKEIITWNDELRTISEFWNLIK